MKKVFALLVVMAFVLGGIAFAADDAAKTAPAAAAKTADQPAVGKAPVAEAAADLTKSAADTAVDIRERRKARRENRREAILGGGKEKQETKQTPAAPATK